MIRRLVEPGLLVVMMSQVRNTMTGPGFLCYAVISVRYFGGIGYTQLDNTGAWGIGVNPSLLGNQTNENVEL